MGVINVTEKELQVLKEDCGEMIMKYSDFRSCMTSFVEKYQVRRALGEIISGAVNGEICSSKELLINNLNNLTNNYV